MRLVTFIAAIWAAPAEAACRLALVLALDVSASVDADEYLLQSEGMARALLAPDVAAEILAEPDRPVAFAAYNWSGPGDLSMIVDWVVVRSEAELQALADRIARHPRRTAFDGRTAIGAALSQAGFLLSTAPPCDRRVVDIATDGRNNSGTEPRAVADGAAFEGATINALAIGEADSGSLATYLRKRVTRGPDSFVEEAFDYVDFEQAMKRKLLRELKDAMVIGALR